MKTPRRRIVIREVFRLMTGLIWIGCALPAFAEPSPDAARTIAIIQPRNVAAYQEAVEGFLRHLRAALPERFNTVIYETPENLYRALEAETSDTSVNSRIALIVTLGNSASNDVAEKIHDIPVVFSMVLEPENRPDPPANVVGASLNIPIELQFEMIASLLPSAKTVGIIYDPQKNAAVAQKHAEAAEASGMRIKAFPVTSPRDLPNALARIGKQADVLLGVVDETVYTSQSAGAIIRYTLKQQLPFIGISSNYVKAGALCALFFDHQDIGRQTAELAAQILSGTPVSALKTTVPEKIHYAINARTAKIIGVTIPKPMLDHASIVYE